jgi:hypothetical protein
VEHCRLETHPNFFEFFVEGCQFKAVEPVKPVEQIKPAEQNQCAS